MIKVEKDFGNIPSILKSKSRKEAFDKNISLQKFTHGQTLYNPDEVKKRLYAIYSFKCVYCEKSIKSEPKHIEHYRPKDRYYWLAYSWDNLLLCCGSCNSIKKNIFEVKNSQVIYGNEIFEDIHNLGEAYDTIEEPRIINPEKEDVLGSIIFDRCAKIFSNDERVQYTIETACKLNRELLIQERVKLINDFYNLLQDHFEFFKKHGDITRFIPVINTFISSCQKENSFYAFRYFILNNIELFFEDNLPLQKIVKNLIEKYENE